MSQIAFLFNICSGEYYSLCYSVQSGNLHFEVDA